MRTSNFTYLVKQGLKSIWHNRLMSFASFCILMVSLLLIGLSLLVGFSLGIVIDNLEEKNEVHLYVDREADKTVLSRIKETLDSNQFVLSYVIKTKEEAWIEMQDRIPDFKELFEYLEEIPLPDTFIVTVNDITKMDVASRQFAAIPGVASINAPQDYAQFLVSMRTTLTIIGSAVLAALILVCLVIVYNSARTSVFARRKEINIMKYVGATNSFIKLPFFIEGVTIGILAGVASWGLTKFAYEALMSVFSNDLTIWSMLGLMNIINFSDVIWIVLGLNCLAGAVLGAAGTLLSMGKHLKV